MIADFHYRQVDEVVTLDRIGQYHAEVYEWLGIPADAWAPNFLHERGTISSSTGVLPRAFRDELSDELFSGPDSEPASPLLHQTSWDGSELPEPVTRNHGGDRHTVEMTIAPGQTRTARVQLPGLTVALTITMPQ
jgi:hypothetical protein